MIKKFNKNSLTAKILLIPSGIILVSFMIIFVAFHVVVQQYINSLTTKIIKNEFVIMDSDYNMSKNTPLNVYIDNEELIVNVYRIIMDENYNCLLPNDTFVYSESEKAKAKEVTKHYAKEKTLPKGKFPVKQTIGSRTYMIRVKTYEGKFDGFFIHKTRPPEDSSRYVALVYTDITSVQDFIKKMDTVLISVLIFFGFFTILSILHMSRKLALSFRLLNAFLRKVGKRKKIVEKPKFAFVEFDNVVDNALFMSQMIDASEEDQKKFFQNASHELRTPLMSIQGYTEGLKYGIIKDTDNAYDIILKESKKMSELVDEILFLSKFEAMTPTFGTVNLSEILHETVDDISLSHENGHISIKMEISPSLLVTGDESLLHKVFKNIVSNATRYAKSVICISSEVEESNVVIHITDDGDGISNEDFPHIFKRFYKGKNGNFGIGLSMANDIVKQHGGEIKVESEKGKTDFIIILPGAVQ